MLKYVCYYLKESSNNLCFYKEGLLASGALEVAFLFKLALKCLNRAFKPKFYAKDVILNNSMLLPFKAIFYNIINLCV
jgi:hypothetical protein